MDWNEYFFKHVFLAASKSKDPSSQVGAVLVSDDKVVISEGYNGFPRGVQDLRNRLENRDTKLAYTVHAEHNAILNCARRGVSTVGSVLYTTAFPCDQCMKAIIQAGIKKVICHEGAQNAFYKRSTSTNWNDTHSDAKTMAQEADVMVCFWPGKAGMKTRIGGNEIDV